MWIEIDIREQAEPLLVNLDLVALVSPNRSGCELRMKDGSVARIDISTRAFFALIPSNLRTKK